MSSLSTKTRSPSSSRHHYDQQHWLHDQSDCCRPDYISAHHTSQRVGNVSSLLGRVRSHSSSRCNCHQYHWLYDHSSRCRSDYLTHFLSSFGRNVSSLTTRVRSPSSSRRDYGLQHWPPRLANRCCLDDLPHSATSSLLTIIRMTSHLTGVCSSLSFRCHHKLHHWFLNDPSLIEQLSEIHEAHETCLTKQYIIETCDS